ncbi:hypothetical protein QEN19_002831 [Hanseniaspora menglaensis]
MITVNNSQNVPNYFENVNFQAIENPAINKSFEPIHTSLDTLTTYSYSNGISDYLKNKIPGMGENIADDHDKPSDMKIIDEAGTVSDYSILRAQLTDIQDQINKYLTDLMTEEKKNINKE